MIRFHNAQAVWMGTLVRLFSLSSLLFIGYSIGSIQGVMVGAAAQGVAVFAEATFNGFRVLPVLRKYLYDAPIQEKLTWRAFASFYIPLVLTSFMTLIWQPIGSAALSRMPRAIESLAVWQVLSGLLFILRSPGTAFNEVVVALMETRGAYRKLRNFATWLASISSSVQLLVAATPLAYLWFKYISALSLALIPMAQTAFWIALPLPALTVLLSWYQGAILSSKKTRAIPESVAIFLSTVVLILFGGVAWGKMVGLYIGTAALASGVALQVLWLYIRSRNVMHQAAIQDESGEAAIA